MLVTPGVKKYWIKMQAQRAYPVNAMGIRIQPENTDLLKRWRTEGIDRFMSKESNGLQTGSAPVGTPMRPSSRVFNMR